MLINWYPGHMAKAVRMMEDNLKIVDAVVYVLDSRAVLSCNNPQFCRLTASKPVLYLLNKSDLVEKRDLNRWLAAFEREGKHAVTTVGTSVNSKWLSAEMRKVCADKISKFAAKGATVSVRAMVIGVPNSGKSTIINSIVGKARAVTGDRPGVTKNKAWYSVDGIDFLDTPGTLWAKFNDQNVAHHLAYVGSIKDEICDSTELCLDFLNEMRKKYPELIKERYKLAELSDNSVELFGQIALSRGFKLKGDQIDEERTAKTVLDDFRKGRIGKIMLELPPEIK